ncbi:hypothetical protein JAAARDRAFT_69191 [Jaapia argillacea MUCL 33604]|uniref:CxC6 like cysteine cluster associated with KDZ domain-containing protein n=1 Tax=Jaapia argillacea MUCL 33604 TaxID=933084 RepID=A0A067PVB6_9AGAM|nr:hypothetical protein JAAARDRAFT_69191 [Jaapia argillacea MUCL 33604]
MNFCDLAEALGGYPGLSRALTWKDVDKYIRFARRLKSEIRLHLSPGLDDPPYRLPQYLHEFLRDLLGFEDLQTMQCWSALRGIIWQDGPAHLYAEEVDAFVKRGSQPSRASEKVWLLRFPVVFYSIQYGACLAYSSSLSCDGCKMRYYPNYYIMTNLRFYYGGIPDTIQFEEHGYMEKDLCEVFTNFMLVAWVSAQNGANIYNFALAANSLCRPTIWPSGLTFNLSGEQVWRAFFLNALLRDWTERGLVLVLPDSGDHDSRLKHAMDIRNHLMIEHGQPEKMHACQVCPLRAVVTDGIAIGHPCCMVHNCTRPLINNRHRFCEQHQDKNLDCVVTDCDAKAEPGHRTCSNSSHRELEEFRNQRGKAFFQLRDRLKRFNISQISDSLGGDDSLPELARFGRRRTHNEQLVVCCCGIIAARSTMFGAEAISGVKDFLKSVYNHNPDDMPDVCWHDNNCRLQQHLRKTNDSFFRRVILAVDVFHFKSKHKESDKFCQKHCNPALWKVLVDKEGKWVFNSSAAEQANVWLGGYLAIVREMLPHRYNFFLDEMIKRRNERLVGHLRKSGKTPYHVPSSIDM